MAARTYSVDPKTGAVQLYDPDGRPGGQFPNIQAFQSWNENGNDQGDSFTQRTPPPPQAAPVPGVNEIDPQSDPPQQQSDFNPFVPGGTPPSMSAPSPREPVYEQAGGNGTPAPAVSYTGMWTPGASSTETQPAPTTTGAGGPAGTGGTPFLNYGVPGTSTPGTGNQNYTDPTHFWTPPPPLTTPGPAPVTPPPAATPNQHWNPGNLQPYGLENMGEISASGIPNIDLPQPDKIPGQFNGQFTNDYTDFMNTMGGQIKNQFGYQLPQMVAPQINTEGIPQPTAQQVTNIPQPSAQRFGGTNPYTAHTFGGANAGVPRQIGAATCGGTPAAPTSTAGASQCGGVNPYMAKTWGGANAGDAERINANTFGGVAPASLSMANSQRYETSPELQSMLGGQGYDPATLAMMRGRATEDTSSAGRTEMAQAKRALEQSGLGASPAGAAVIGDVARRSGIAGNQAQRAIDIQNAQTGMENRRIGLGQQTQIGLANTGQANQIALAKAASRNNMAQFNAEMANQTGMFNAEQINEVSKPNQAAANQMRQFNAQLSQQTGLANTGAENEASQFNAGQAQEAGLYNTGQANQVALANAASSNNMAQFNAELSKQTGMFNAQQINEVSKTNQAAANQMRQFNAQLSQQAGLANTGAQNEAEQFNSGQAQETGMFNAGQANEMAGQNANRIANVGTSNMQAANQMALENANRLFSGMSQNLSSQRATQSQQFGAEAEKLGQQASTSAGFLGGQANMFGQASLNKAANADTENVKNQMDWTQQQAQLERNRSLANQNVLESRWTAANSAFPSWSPLPGTNQNAVPGYNPFGG